MIRFPLPYGLNLVSLQRNIHARSHIKIASVRGKSPFLLSSMINLLLYACRGLTQYYRNPASASVTFSILSAKLSCRLRLARFSLSGVSDAMSITQLKVLTLNIIRIMNIKPLADRVLVLPAPAEEKIGGIIIPDTAKEKPLRGKIVAAGNGTKDEEMILKEGDEVLYGKYAGTELEFEGEKYLIMRQSDVLAVMK